METGQPGRKSSCLQSCVASRRGAARVNCGHNLHCARYKRCNTFSGGITSVSSRRAAPILKAACVGVQKCRILPCFTINVTALLLKMIIVDYFYTDALNSWRGDLNSHRVENNMLINFARGNLETVKEYRNFVMRFEFRLSHHADNGVNIRKSGGSNGFEINVIDDNFFQRESWAWGYHGSIFPWIPARRGSLNAVGQWNAMEITANGSMIRVVTNDQIVVDTDIRNIYFPRRNPVDNAALQNKSGHLEFTGAREQTEFRNIRIKELP